MKPSESSKLSHGAIAKTYRRPGLHDTGETRLSPLPQAIVAVAL